MEDNTITITFETIFELLRNERNKVELQKLPSNFYEDVQKYLKDKKEFIEKTKGELFSDETTRNKEHELINIKKILKDLYDKREAKIINLARDKSRTRSNLIDTTNLSDQEMPFFDRVVNVLDTYREGILIKLMEGNPPEVKIRKDISDDPSFTFQNEQPGTSESDKHKEIRGLEESKSGLNGLPKAAIIIKTTKLIRFLSPVPKFVGPELEEYGPFDKEDIANLPKEIAVVLISKGRAEEIVET